MFMLFANVIPGIAYWRADKSFLLLAGFSLFSSASLLFISPAISTLLINRCIHLFQLEKADGVCSSWQLVLHTFIHMVALTTVPYLVATAVIFGMVVELVEAWTFSMYAMVALLNLMLNAAEMALVRHT